jgi:hypothetical protein
MSAVEDIPISWQSPIMDTDPVPSMNQIRADINLMRGYIMGLASRVDDAEEKVDMALAYQREVDALFLETVAEEMTKRSLYSTAKIYKIAADAIRNSA